MKTIAELLAHHPFFEAVDASTVDLLAGCGTNMRMRAGALLFQEGDPADRFYLVRDGRVAILVHQTAGGPLILDTVEAGGVVGWSWLVPPYRWRFDARASEDTRAVAFDAVCLRARCEADPAVGYQLMKAVNRVMLHRLESARLRLLDMYAAAPSGARLS